VRYRRSFGRVYLYVAREFTFSFLVSFSFFFFIFFVNQILLLAEDILTKNVGVLDVLRLVLYSLPSIVALSFPFGALVGCLMAIGRLSSDNEIIAFRASGVSLGRLFIPVALLGAAFSVVSFVMNDYFLPLGTINFGRLYRELLYRSPELELEPYSITRYQDSVIITGAVGKGRIDDLVIIERNKNGGDRTILAKSASLKRESGSSGVISLDLNDVFSQSTKEKNSSEYEYTKADGMTYNILLQDIAYSIRSPGPREMSSRDVYADIQKKEQDLAARRKEQNAVVRLTAFELYQTYVSDVVNIAAGSLSPANAQNALEKRRAALVQERNRPVTDRSLQIYSIEFYKKFSIPFACLTFVVFAFPVGLLTRRSGRAVGFGVGLFVSIVYWSLLIGGQTFGMQRPNFSPFLAMWIPNFVILVAGTAFYVVRARR